MSVDPNRLFRPGVRLATSYFLDCADRIVRTLDEDLGPSVVFLAIVWANIANQALSLSTADEGGGVRAIERRAPVSVVRLAQSLGLPFETVRRYSVRLRDAGLCERQTGGLVVPSAVVDRAPFDTCLEQTWIATGRFAADLEALGVPLPAPSGVADDEARRWVSRHSARYFLRGLELTTTALGEDLLSSMVFLAVNRANVAALFEDHSLALAYEAPDAVRPDAFRRPATVQQIADTLRLPYETTRRRATQLVARGACQRAGGGLIVPGAVLSSPAIVAAMQEAWRLTPIFIGTMRRLGLP